MRKLGGYVISNTVWVWVSVSQLVWVSFYGLVLHKRTTTPYTDTGSDTANYNKTY